MIHILLKRKKSTEIEIISKERQGGVQWNIPCYRVQDRCDIVMSSVVENFGLHPLTREKREKRVFKNRIPLRELSDWKVFIVGYMFMEIQDKSIVMSSPIRLSKILVYICLHEKNGKNAFSKIGFRLGELSDWNVFIVGYTFMEIQDKCIVMSSVVENFGLHLPTREKREKGVSKNQIPLRRAFRLKSVYRRIHVHGNPR